METVDLGQQVVVIGGGATGSWAAHKLTEVGVPVLLLEAGAWPQAESLPHARPQAPLDMRAERARLHSTKDRRTTHRIQRGCYAFTPQTSRLFVSDADHPYSVGPGTAYRWIRVRGVGGRTLVWNGIAVRMMERDLDLLRPGGTWPIDWSELDRHYRDVEAFFGVAYGNEQHAALHADIRGRMQRRWPTREILPAPRFQSSASDESTDLPGHSCRQAIESAMRTGHLVVRPNSLVTRLETDAPERRITGVELVDTCTHDRLRVTGRAFLLCASALESTRILLNSSSQRHPTGLGNASGLLGRYLSDHLVGVAAVGVKTTRGGHGQGVDAYREFYLPPFRNVTEAAPGFIGTYGVQMSVAGSWAGHKGDTGTSRCVLHAFGTVIPRRENLVVIDPSIKDVFGNPSLRISAQYGENEASMAADQATVLGELLQALGYRIVHRASIPDIPGASMHEVGTARMGASEQASVLDPWNRVWGVDNLFVTDGACFVTMGAANPTLTMLALTGRASEEVGRRLSLGVL